MMTLSTTLTSIRSPFKFLDPYGQNDRSIFFGRDEEIKGLYDVLLTSKLLLVYGASGTGKTSLIECGVANKFSDADWLAVRVRRSGIRLLDATFATIKSKAIEPLPVGATLAQAVESLYVDHYIPIYFIFDQFEELFIQGEEATETTESEAKAFFNALADLLRAKVACKVVLVIREEYLAFLSEYEKTVSILFDNRFRVERMNQTKLEQVVKGTIQTPQYHLRFDDPETNTPLIIENLRGERREVDLTNLQVYLDRLYKADWRRADNMGLPRPPYVFDKALIEQVGKLPQVMSDFLDEQVHEVDAEVNRPDTALNILMAFVTSEGTKISRNPERIKLEMEAQYQIDPSLSEACMQAFLERRILRELRIGDKLRYEIVHDLLAGYIHDRFSAEEKSLRRVRRIVQDYFDVHTEAARNATNVVYLPEEQLFQVQKVRDKLDLQGDLLQYVKDSETALVEERNAENIRLQKELQLEKERKSLQDKLLERERQDHEDERQVQLVATKRRNRALRRSVLLSLLVSGLAVFSLLQWQKSHDYAEESTINALYQKRLKDSLQISKDEFVKQQQELSLKESANRVKMFNDYLTEGKAHLAANRYDLAINSINTALTWDSTKKQAFQPLLNDARHQADLQKQFEAYILRGNEIVDTLPPDKILKPQLYNEAQHYYSQADSLVKKQGLRGEKNITMIKDEKHELNIKINFAFEKYKDKGERFKKAQAWVLAADNYKKAYELKPDSAVLNKIEECKRGLSNK